MDRAAGVRPTLAHNGEQALQMLASQDFDAVLLDTQMPVMDGTELVERIRQGRTEDITPTDAVRAVVGNPDGPLRRIPQDIPIIALTAHAMTGDKERFLTLGMDYYLSKPIIAEKLRSMLNHVGALLVTRNDK